ncbi:terminase large subunit [Vibrio phage 1.256.O._10N.286.45.F8]|nr:terminase large subunit [Vibrio phage 1.256.O._10N.286.45.F8]
MAKLSFKPQKVFAPAYYTDAADIRRHRSIFREEYTNFVDRGGRGGGKTVDKIKAVIIEMTLRPIRVLATREYQVSIEESVKAEMEAAIDELNLGYFFTITKTNIVAANGSKVLFKGLRNNINNIKSISDVDLVLVEEAENVSDESWKKLLPSIRPKSGRAIIIVLFNPFSELDPTYQRWIVDTPPRTLLTLVNYYDNKYFPKLLEEQRQHAEKTLPKKEYEYIWLGKPLGSGDDVIIDLEWVKAARFASQSEGWQRIGKKIVGYDPAGQGRDYNAVAAFDGNVLTEVDEWLKSPDLRQASERAFGYAVRSDSKFFVYDECGGFGDGVSVFIGDAKDNVKKELIRSKQNSKAIDFIKMRVAGFNAGNPVHMPDKKVNGTKKTNGEIYTNLKAQTWGVVAQQFYNTYRYVVLGERDIDMRDMISIDIEDDSIFNKLARELSTPIWEKSDTNSKKKVESKAKMEKRTGQASPNLADAVVMTRSPKLPSGNIGGML